MTLTKADLVKKVYATNERFSKSQAVQVVESLLRISKETLISGEDLLLSGFGKFSIKNKNARRGRNPQTGEEITLEARRVVTFKASGNLRKTVDQGNGIEGKPVRQRR